MANDENEKFILSNNLASNNYCNIGIQSVSISQKNQTSILAAVSLYNMYYNTYLEYILYDVNPVNNIKTLLKNWTRLSQGDHIFQYSEYEIVSVTDCYEIGFRLVQPCPTGSVSTGSGGSISSGGSAGSSSGGASGNSGNSVDQPVLFDKSSWNTGQVPTPMALIMNAAADQWQSQIKFDNNIVNNLRISNPLWNGIVLNSYVESDSGPGFVASCGVESAISLGNNQYNSLSFNLYINTYYYNNPNFSNISWTKVLLHELGHALGVGTLWNVALYDVWLNGNTYPLAQASYNTTYNITRSKIPVEDTGSIGTVSVHWEDNYRPAGYQTGEPFYIAPVDIMIGTVTNANIGPVTKNFLLDLGYVNNTSPNFVNMNNINISNINFSTTEKLHYGCGAEEHAINIPNITHIYDSESDQISEISNK